jgi:hypothetical protein
MADSKFISIKVFELKPLSSPIHLIPPQKPYLYGNIQHTYSISFLKCKALLNLPVDFRFMLSEPRAVRRSSGNKPAGSPFDSLLPQDFE